MTTHKQLYGMEVELEVQDHLHFSSSKWRCESDGTLRNGGREYILQAPMTREDLLVAHTELVGKIGKITPETISSRTSSHIHIDVREISMTQRCALYLKLVQNDRIFFEDCPERMRSPFCIPTSKHPHMISAGLSMIQGTHHPSLDGKYSSINTMCLSPLGTLELRHFTPVIETKRLEKILSVIHEGVQDVVNSISGRSSVDQFSAILPPHLVNMFWKEGGPASRKKR